MAGPPSPRKDGEKALSYFDSIVLHALYRIRASARFRLAALAVLRAAVLKDKGKGSRPRRARGLQGNESVSRGREVNSG